MHVEFDFYADEYDAGMKHPIKAMLGKSSSSFLLPKSDWLVKYLTDIYLTRSDDLTSTKLLEVGCGTGLFISSLIKSGFSGELFGTDISEKMLTHAARNLSSSEGRPVFTAMQAATLPYESCKFDFVVACSLLHHVPAADRPALFNEFRRVLVPGGLLIVFEHNPWNPITQFVVRTTPIDRNASMLTSTQIRYLASKCDFRFLLTEYLLSIPPVLPYSNAVNRFLHKCPFGAQYVATMHKEAQ